MNQEYDNTNRGALFSNKRKSSPKQPDVTGELNFEGTELRLAGWVQTAKSGLKFFSLVVERAEEKPAEAEEKSDPIGDVMGESEPVAEGATNALPPSDDIGEEDVPF